MKSRKLKVPGEIFMAIGLFFVAFAISLMVKLGFGISTISSLAYALHLIMPFLSFGEWNLAFQTVLFVILISITRKFKRKYLVSFAMVLLFAAMLDITDAMIGGVPDELYLRVPLFGGSFLLMCFGVSMMITSKMPLTIVEMFSNSLASHYHTSFRRIKTMFDVTCLTISAAVSLFFLGDLAGIGIGTVVMAIITGTFIQAFGTLLNDHFEIEPYYETLRNRGKSATEGAKAKE
ncbi:MAG: DUF6198 family protein [Candidatus Methanomethylophilaceae archaeon]|jgi:uncharacterized membrane protein YczE|nr:DUF6198 family protein [Candidatus Methanomethylophilaceae archaeon]MDD3350919.1 DUF6198 family protein [Candidatus Methanomethylophilaceae archaeon]MDD3986593.1 DUF6198 family protein [Candidatus Methanomethylophilaceae archaeon]MDY0251601.1 DUF6198 family protein [Candidatus Methanomethylophilaceae archaeon]